MSGLQLSNPPPATLKCGPIPPPSPPTPGPAPPSPTPAPPQHKHHSNTTVTVILVIAGVLCLLGCFFYKLKATADDSTDDDPLLAALKQEEPHNRGWNVSMNTVTFQQLRRATNNFDAAHRIGDGGSCTVYKAIIYGCECAVKVLSSEADEWESKQFAAEVDVLTRVKHPNLVELHAYSTDGKRKCLVLECMDCALDMRLLADDKPPLGWQQRAQIIVSVCRALVHLHSLTPKPLIHRDVKSQNVLLLGFETDTLDDESVAKVADFGTVRVDTRNTDGKLRTSAQTHASTARVVGTKPYMPNEYTRKGHVSEKTDSFAMGILVSKGVERSEKSECSNSLFPYSRYAILLSLWVFQIISDDRAAHLRVLRPQRPEPLPAHVHLRSARAR